MLNPNPPSLDPPSHPTLFPAPLNSLSLSLPTPKFRRSWGSNQTDRLRTAFLQPPPTPTPPLPIPGARQVLLANHGSQQLGRERGKLRAGAAGAPHPRLARSPLRSSEAPSSCSEATGGLGSILKRARRCADARDDVSALMSASRNGELSGGGGGRSGGSSGGGSDGKSPAAQPDSPKTAPRAGHARGRESRSRLAGVALQRLLLLLLQPPETPSPPPPAWDGSETRKEEKERRGLRDPATRVSGGGTGRRVGWEGFLRLRPALRRLKGAGPGYQAAGAAVATALPGLCYIRTWARAEELRAYEGLSPDCT